MTQHVASLADVRAAQRRAHRKSHTPHRWREDSDARWSRQREGREELARFRELQQEEYDRMWPELEDPMSIREVLGL